MYELTRRGEAKDGDLVIISKGDLDGVLGGTNTLKIVRIGEVHHAECIINNNDQ